MSYREHQSRSHRNSRHLLIQIDRIVGKRGRSQFLARAAEKELMRLGQIQAIEAASGCWKGQNHPELKAGAAKWVEKLRRRDEKRFQQVTAR